MLRLFCGNWSPSAPLFPESLNLRLVIQLQTSTRRAGKWNQFLPAVLSHPNSGYSSKTVAGGSSAKKKYKKKKTNKKSSASIFYTQHMPGSEHALFLLINNVLFSEICSCSVTFLRTPPSLRKKRTKNFSVCCCWRRNSMLFYCSRDRKRKPATLSVFLIASHPVMVQPLTSPTDNNKVDQGPNYDLGASSRARSFLIQSTGIRRSIKKS